jgi:predicted alpha/beta hydrolase family esterase
MARFLLLHGFGGIGPDHWLVWLSGELRARGHVARIRKLPAPNAPDFDTWLATMRERLAALDDPAALAGSPAEDDRGELIVVAHSLGARLWLHHAAGGSDGLPIADRAALVALPSLPPGDQGRSGFYGLDANAVDPARVARHTRAVVSSNDRYWPDEGAIEGLIGPLGLPVDRLGDCGHFEPPDGFGPWPGMLSWCLGEAETITR